MAGEQNFFSSFWESVTGFVGSVFRRNVTEKFSTKVGALANSLAIGFGAGSVINIYASWREYRQAQDELLSSFTPEIAAKLGKKPEDVTVSDLNKAAQNNPALAEAIRRNKKSRNLNFGINTASLLIAIALTTFIVPILLHTAVAAATLHGAVTIGTALINSAKVATVLTGAQELIASAIVGLGAFLAVEKPLEILGKKLFGLSEPKLHDVEKKPRKQHELSLPSQIDYIEHLQTRKIPIGQEQVMTVFVTANPVLAAHIASRYGNSFENLTDATREQVVKDLGPTYRIETLTEDLNGHRIRAQELAFAAYGQSSGMPLPAAPAPVAPMAPAENDSAPDFSYRTFIIEERQKNQQQKSSQPAAGQQH